MPYELKTDKLSHKFLNASQIAILLSLGLHLLVYKYGFPTLLIKEEPRNRDNTVSTIALNPLEQTRLPNLEPQLNIPTFNNTPLDEAAPPFALPLPPNFDPSASLPPIPVPPVSSDIELPPLGITDLADLPLPPSLEDFDSLTPPDAPVTTPEAEGAEEAEEVEEAKEVEEVEEAEEAEEAEVPPEDRPTPEQIAVVRQQKLQGNIRDLSLNLQKQDIATTDEEARKNYVNWLSKIEDVEPEAVEITGIYPKDACIRRLEGTSVYGVVVDENNTVVALELIKGAEYPIFNERASKDIQQHDFANETQEITPYQVTVDYKYDEEICPSLTLPSLREEPVPASKPEGAEEIEGVEGAEEIEGVEEVEEVEEVEGVEEAEEVEEVEGAEEAEEIEGVEEAEPPSLRERLQNTPLPNNDNIRERLRNNPLPEESTNFPQ